MTHKELILKGILLWSTFALTLLLISCIDSIDFIPLVLFIVLDVAFIIFCTFNISEEEFKIVTGYDKYIKWITEASEIAKEHNL